MIIKAIVKVVFVAAVSLVFSACSSQSAIKANFYLLNDASNQTDVEAQKTDSSPTVLINKIQISDYLRQPNIAMQLNDHQLYYSNNHLWAEKLDSAITKSLLNDLNQKSSNSKYVSREFPVISETSAKLTVEIEHFIATVNSKVVLSGQFWLVSNNSEDVKMSKNIKRNFRYSLTLEKDGYPHSVAKLRQLLALLSDEISALVEAQAFK